MEHNLPDIEAHLLLITRQFLLEQEADRALRAISLDASLERELGIDSLGKAELFHRIESTLGLSFSDSTIADCDSLRAIATASLTAHPSKKYKQQTFTPTLQGLTIDLSKTNTLQEVLIEYAIHEPERPHIYLQDDQGVEEILTYGELLSEASNIANSLINFGIKPDDTIAIMLPTCRGFFQSFFGVLLAGAIPVPIYPPFRPDRIEEYAVREAKILNNAEVRMLITFSQAELLSKILQAHIPSLKKVVTTNDLLSKKSGSLPQIVRTPEHAVLIQYTSGSTGDPKGVLLLQKNMMANIRAIEKALKPQSTDVVVSWLPLYHDMGLMSWIGSLYFGIPMTILSPMTFLNHPEKWLWAIHYHRATISAAPNFAYELCVKKIHPESIEGLDLSSWRFAFNGAEFVNPQTLIRFYEKFKKYNLKETATTPVYGLAENTVALAFPEEKRAPYIDRVNREIFEKELRAIPSTNHHDYLEFVAEGKPLPDHEIRIVNAADELLDDRVIGNVQFRGPSAMQGYYRNQQATEAVYHNGWWDTGDLGYVADGELFVTGRKKDLIIKAGRNLYPETIEDSVSNVTGIRKGCIIAFGVTDPRLGTEKIIVVAESNMLDKTEELQNTIIEHVAIDIGVPPDQVVIVPPHTIPKTSSGKLQRSACKQAYLQGELKGKHSSFHWQFTKLSLQAIKQKILHVTNKIFRAIYSLYVAIIILITTIPMLLITFCIPTSYTNRIIKRWARLLLTLIFCRVKIVNSRLLDTTTPVIFAANHASYVDSILLLAFLPTETLFVVKKELLNAPLIGRMIKKLNYLIVDRWDFSKNLDDVKKIESSLTEKHSILIFPEGTFTYASGLRPFKTGTFQLAVDTQTSICPIAIKGSRQFLRDDNLLLSPVKITITICDLIHPYGQDWQAITQLRNEVRKQIAQNCGEPSIDLIAAGPELPKNENK
jgi:1-acyl-sn-glycerol-3-phosphate acyltransferase